MVHRRIQIKVFSPVKKTVFVFAAGRRWMSFWQRRWRFCFVASEMTCTGTRRNADTWRSRITIQRFSDLSGTFSCSWLIVLWTDHFANIFNVFWSTDSFGSTASWFSHDSRFRFINTFANRLNRIHVPLFLRTLCRNNAISEALLT